MAFTPGSIDLAGVLNGPWTDLRVNAAGPGTVYSLGNTPDAVLTIEQTVSEYREASIGQLVCTLLPQQQGMMFECSIPEHHINNWNVLLGELPATAGNCRYPGTRVKGNFLTVQGTRLRNEDSVQIIFKIYRGGVTGDVAFGGIGDAATAPLRFVATKDTLDSMGAGASTANPIGDIYIPNPTATVTGL